MPDDKRTVLITGCSDGSLGSALALALHKQGSWRVFASARNLAKLGAVKAAGIECVKVDVGSEESIAACVDEVRGLTGGTLDALINNAGTGYSIPLIHVDISQAHDLFDLNVFSIIRVTRAFLPLLIKSSAKGGAIVANNTSAGGLLGVGIPFHGAYAASKAAANSMTESLRLELGPFGIRVVNLVTGGVKTSFFANASTPGLPEDSIYNIAKEAIEGPMSGDIPGLSDADTWAGQVAGDLSGRKVPHMIFRGYTAGTARLATHFPTGTLDGMLKKSTGIDVLEKKVKEQGGPAQLKIFGQ